MRIQPTPNAHLGPVELRPWNRGDWEPGVGKTLSISHATARREAQTMDFTATPNVSSLSLAPEDRNHLQGSLRGAGTYWGHKLCRHLEHEVTETSSSGPWRCPGRRSLPVPTVQPAEQRSRNTPASVSPHQTQDWLLAP